MVMFIFSTVWNSQGGRYLQPVAFLVLSGRFVTFFWEGACGGGNLFCFHFSACVSEEFNNLMH